MKTIRSNAKQILNENYRNYVSGGSELYPNSKPNTISELCELETESDPYFYSWLFNDPEIEDFGNNLTDEEKELAIKFFESL